MGPREEMGEGAIDVVVAGHLCLDMIPLFENPPIRRVDGMLRPGALVNVGTMRFAAGGPVANTGMAMRAFGNKVHFMAKVGDDPIGRITHDLLQRYGETEGVLVSRAASSSYTVVLSPKGIDRIFLHYPGANDSFGLADVSFKMLEKAKLFHFGYPPLMKRMYDNAGEQLAMIFRRAKECGATTSLDMSLPDCDSPSGKADWEGILERTLPHVDIFLPSIEESLFALYPDRYMLTKTEHPHGEMIEHIDPAQYCQIAERFIAYGCKMTSLKSGFRGWYFKTACKSAFQFFGRVELTDIDNWCERELWCPAFGIQEIASATGAGDASIAGFLSALLRGCTVEECLRYANAAGNQSLTELDAVSGLTDWKGLSRLIRTGQVALFPLKDRQWEWDSAKKLWERKTRRRPGPQCRGGGSQSKSR